VIVRGRSHVKRVMRCHARTVRRKVVVIVHQHGKTVTIKRFARVVLLPHLVNESRLRIAYGKRTTVSGVLLLANGTALSGRTVEILSAPDDGLQQFAPAATATTAANGGWTTTLAPGPSRLVEAVYGGDSTTEPVTTAPVMLTVPAKIELLNVTHRVPWGGTVRIVGELEGGHLPADGALVRLVIGYGKASTTYGVKEHITSRRFVTTFTFGAGNPKDIATYWFRLATLPQGDYPYAPHASGRRYVLVGGNPPSPRGGGRNQVNG
jgi:hypothetical protein